MTKIPARKLMFRSKSTKHAATKSSEKKMKSLPRLCRVSRTPGLHTQKNKVGALGMEGERRSLIPPRKVAVQKNKSSV